MHMRFIFENRGAGQNLAEQRRLGKERRSFFPILSLRRLRLATAGQILSLGTALILLGLAVPDAGVQSQPFTTRNPDQDFNTFGLAGSNKNPVGLCDVKHPTNGKYMLVSDGRDDKIYAYDLNSTNKTRLDSHHTTEEDSKDNDDFLLHPDNQNPVGIWADNETDDKSFPPILWVVDAADKKIYSYSLYLTNMPWIQKDKSETTLITTNALKGSFRTDNGTTQQKNNQITLDAANDDPTGLWADDTYIYVANEGPDKIFAYKRTLGVGETEANRRVPSKEFDLVSASNDNIGQGQGNTFPQGIWSDGETMWVSDFKGFRTNQNKKIFAYKLKLGDDETEDDRRVPSKEFETLQKAGNERPRGIWSDGTTMWVADKIDNKIYAYHGFRKTHDRNPNEDFNGLSDAGNHAVQGIWSNGETMWVADKDDDKLYAYDLAAKARDLAKEIAASNTNALLNVDLFKSYIWSNGTNIWVSSFNRDGTYSDRSDDTARIYAYKLADGSRDTSQDFDNLINTNLTYRGNDRPRGIWSDGTTMWVAENDDSTNAVSKIYAYNLITKARVSNQDFNTLHDAENRNPSGLWSDETTMWVADLADGKIYAYNMWTNSSAGVKTFDGSRDASKDYDTLLAAGNHRPSGLWSDETTMWVADSADGKIYAYNTDVVEARLGLLVVKGLVPSREKEDNPNPREEDFEVKLFPPFNSRHGVGQGDCQTQSRHDYHCWR